MAVFVGSFILVCCYLFSIFNLVFGNVPVLIWESNKNNKENGFSALSRVSTDAFSQYMLKKVQGQESSKPMVVLFEEENLSVEDLSGQDSQLHCYYSKLRNITASAAAVEFFPSVKSPVEAIKRLGENGYKIKYLEGSDLPNERDILLIVKLQDANVDEDRPELLKRHDDKITEIYSELLADYSHVIAVFTGLQGSWVEPEELTRLKRDVRDNVTAADIHWKTGSTGQQVLLYSSSVPDYNDGTSSIPLSQWSQRDPTKAVSGNTLTLGVRFYKDTNAIDFNFMFTSNGGYWALDNVKVVTSDSASTKSTNFLIPLLDLYAPMGKSYHSSLPLVFYSNSTKAKLTFSDLQVEPFFETTDRQIFVEKFDDAVDNITFFTIPIWSGIFTVTILSLIFIWGITMIMDVRTMDQFDDPKGKTITVTTSE